MSQLLDKSTILIRETYHQIDPGHFPPVEYYSGRALNPPEDAEDIDNPVSTDGHRIVYVNEIFEDSEHRQFRVIDVLGNGTFSYVFKCQMMSDKNKFVALKIIKNLPQYHATGVSEILVHQLLSHAPDHKGKKHVIIPISTFEIDGHICMVLPLLSRSLFEGICQVQSPIQILSTVKEIMRQLLQALAFIHQGNVIHCDVKPDNILYSEENTDDILLIDFGSATTTGSGQGQYIQSRFYRSFEVMLGLQFNSMIDIWSAGCVAAELFLDFAIFACECESDAVHTMVALLGTVPESLLSASQNWWKFYDMTPMGFKLKMDPNEVLLTRHLYHSIYESTGTVPLKQLILEHCPLRSSDEVTAVKCFSHFVHGLLEYDTSKRYSAVQALEHPFLTGNPFTEDWKPTTVTRLRPAPMERRQQTLMRTNSLDRLTTNDFLSLM